MQPSREGALHAGDTMWGSMRWKRGMQGTGWLGCMYPPSMVVHVSTLSARGCSNLLCPLLLTAPTARTET